MSLRADSRVEPRPHVHAREFDGEMVILDAEGGEYYALDELGARVWKRMEQGCTFGEVANEVHADYDVEITVLLNDLLSLGNEWIRRGLVQPMETTSE